MIIYWYKTGTKSTPPFIAAKFLTFSTMSEASQIVPGLRIFVGTAVHVIMSFEASFLLLCFPFSIYWHPKWRAENQARNRDGKRTEEGIRPQQWELHELPYTKSVNIRAFDVPVDFFYIYAKIFSNRLDIAVIYPYVYIQNSDYAVSLT